MVRICRAARPLVIGYQNAASDSEIDHDQLQEISLLTQGASARNSVGLLVGKRRDGWPFEKAAVTVGTAERRRWLLSHVGAHVAWLQMSELGIRNSSEVAVDGAM